MQTYVLDFRHSNIGGAVVPGRLTLANPTPDSLQRCTRVTFLIHGLDVSRQFGMGQLLALGARISGRDDEAAVAVLWPSDSAVIGPLCYPFATNNADDTAIELATFIQISLQGCRGISFVAHSLGCRVALETVRHLWIAGVPVNQVCLMAGAVDNDCLASPYAYQTAAGYVTRVAVLSSMGDRVLRDAYPAANALSAFTHGASTCDVALGLTGPSPAMGGLPHTVMSVQIDRSVAVDHGDYFPDQQGGFNSKQLAAARFADAVVAGAQSLSYVIDSRGTS